MAIVQFKCSECNRTVELQRETNSIEIMHGCIITAGCRGVLSQVDVLDDYKNGRLTESVAGLEDWVQRKTLHNHTQTLENSVWTVKHDMSAVPNVIAFVNHPIEGNPGFMEKIEPTVTIIDQNTVTLTFDRPWSGIAQLITKSTSPRIVTVAEEVISRFIITANGELTIATRDLNPANIIINIEITTPAGETTLVPFVVDSSQSINSPWHGRDDIWVLGNRYHVRSFDATNFLIPRGATFKITSVSTGPIVPGSLLIMLHKPPHTTFDCIFDQIIDVADLSSDALAISYDGAELSVLPNKLKNVYPRIEVVR